MKYPRCDEARQSCCTVRADLEASLRSRLSAASNLGEQIAAWDDAFKELTRQVRLSAPKYRSRAVAVRHYRHPHLSNPAPLHLRMTPTLEGARPSLSPTDSSAEPPPGPLLPPFARPGWPPLHGAWVAS